MIAAADAFMAKVPAPTYRVGGSVRDEILGRAAHDPDYIVCGMGLACLTKALEDLGASVTPLQLRGDGPQIGVRVTASFGCAEVCLPRGEVSTGGGRHDFIIRTSPSLPLEEDAKRRDFTINALYKDVRTGKILAPLPESRDDFEGRLIRTTHPSSFADDPLRTLRALRFLSTLPDFALTQSCYAEMTEHAHAVTGLTRKGVSSTALDELCRMLMGARPALALRTARDTGVLIVLLPELSEMVGFDQESKYHDKTVDEHTFDAVQAAADEGAPLTVRLALLFHDSGKPRVAWRDEDGHLHYYSRDENSPPHETAGAELASEALWRLNAPRELRQDVVRLIERHMLRPKKIRSIVVHQLRAELGDDLLGALLLHCRCDLLGKGKDDGTLEFFERMKAVHTQAKAARVPRSVKELAVNGEDLLALGLRGRRLGEVQRELLHEVMGQPKLNEREWLLARAERLARK